jgi:hypothetical protein
MSINHGIWNGGQLFRLPKRKEWLFVKDIKNCVADNCHRRFIGDLDNISVNFCSGRYLVMIDDAIATRADTATSLPWQA